MNKTGINTTKIDVKQTIGILIGLNHDLDGILGRSARRLIHESNTFTESRLFWIFIGKIKVQLTENSFPAVKLHMLPLPFNLIKQGFIKLETPDDTPYLPSELAPTRLFLLHHFFHFPSPCFWEKTLSSLLLKIKLII